MSNNSWGISVITEIGSSIKPNHQVKLVQIPGTRGIRLFVGFIDHKNHRNGSYNT